MLQRLEEERKQAEETKFYVGEVSLEDILDQGSEDTSPIELIQQSPSQASYLRLTSEEEKLRTGDSNTIDNQFEMTSEENFISSGDSPEDRMIDTILKEALENYEAQLSPAERVASSYNNNSGI